MPSILSVSAFLASAVAVSATFDASSNKNVAIYWVREASVGVLYELLNDTNFRVRAQTNKPSLKPARIPQSTL